jgi:hypothetical protein
VTSAIALALSITVAYLTLFRRGKLGMTQPVLIGFLSEQGQPKVFMRALLYTTGKRGHLVEALYLKVHRATDVQTFDFWMYGQSSPDMIGSGLRVGEDGVAFNHYFLPPRDASLKILAGEYRLEVYGKILNRRQSVLLRELAISLSEELATAYADPKAVVLFRWLPESGLYRAEIDRLPTVGRSHSVSGAGSDKLPWA